MDYDALHEREIRNGGKEFWTVIQSNCDGVEEKGIIARANNRSSATPNISR